jgi:hypothetical protein
MFLTRLTPNRRGQVVKSVLTKLQLLNMILTSIGKNASGKIDKLLGMVFDKVIF